MTGLILFCTEEGVKTRDNRGTFFAEAAYLIQAASEVQHQLVVDAPPALAAHM